MPAPDASLDPTQDTLRLSPQQRLAWLRSDAGVGADWTVADVLITAAVTPEALLAALDGIAEDEEILRTAFRAPVGVRVPYQVIGSVPVVHRLPDGIGESALRLAAARTMATLGPGGALGGTIVAGATCVAGGVRLMLAFPAIAVDGPGALRVVALLLRTARSDEPVQYADVSEWLLDLRDGPDGDAIERGLAQYGAGTGGDAVLVPFAHDPAGPRRYESTAIALPAATTLAVAAQAGAWGVGIDAWWLAVHAALLHRYVDAETPVMGMVLDGRDQPELDAVIGRLSRVVPVAVAIAPDTSLRGLASETALVIAGLRDRLDHWPPAVPPTVMTHHVAVHSTDRWPDGVAASGSMVVDSAEPFVTRTVIEPNRLTIDYDAARIDATATALLLRQIADIAEQAVGMETAPIKSLTPRITVAQRTSVPPGGTVVAERVAQTAAADPTRPAVRHGNDLADYRALNAQATAFAQGLVAYGVRPGDRVVLALDNGIGHVAAYLAIWRAGAACVPVDAAGPSERLAAIVADAAPALIVADRWTITKACRVVRPDELQAAAAENALPTVDPAIPAYLIYTSGTTGVPKGVMVSHAALAAYVDAVTGRLDLSADAEMGTLAGPDVDLGYTALFVALGTGRTLRLLPDKAATDTDLLLAELERRPLDCLKIVPQHFAGLLVGVDPARRHVLVPRQCLVFGGDRLDASLVAEVRRLHPDCRVVNHYGPSETTIGVLTVPVHERPGPLPIGYALDCVDAVVGDGRGRPIAAGFAGELWVAGPTVALGYRDRPGLTAERFRPARSGATPGGRAYRTGDRVRQLADGSIAFLGRVDHQVKLRGVRIELGEVEAALRALFSIEEAVVAVIDGSLVAFVRTAADTPLDRPAIQRSLGDRLSPAMIPHQIVSVATFDRTASGKIDRRRLVSLAKPEAQSGGAAPRTPVEAILVEVIAQLIGVPGFGIYDNYFALGGDSIISIQVAAQVRRRGVEISANMLFHHQTVAELAAAAVLPTAINAEQGTLSGPVPLLPIQRRFFARNHPDKDHYNQSVALACATLDEAAFVRAVDDVLDHHDMLRARFTEHADGWRQDIAPSADAESSFVRHDLSAVAAPDREAAMGHAATTLQASLDLAEGPVFKAGWFGGGGGGRLVIVAHHLVVDAVSWHVLLDDLFSAYAAHVEGRSWTAPAKTTSFGAFAAHVIDAESRGEFAAELPFWRAQAGDETAPPPERGLDGCPDTVAASRTLSFDLSAADTNALLACARKSMGGSVQELITGAIAAAVADWSGHSSVTIEMESQGREPLSAAIDPSRTVGWFTARYPIRLTPTTSDAAGFARAAKTALREVPRRGIGYGLLSRHGSGAIDAPIPFVSVNYLGQLSSGGDADASWRPIPDGAGEDRAATGHRDHPVAFNIQVADGVLHVRLTYAAGRITTATATAIGEAVLDGLQHLSIADPARLRTATDFPLAGFASDTALDQWLAARQIDNAVDIYPLSELQRGMAVQALLAPRSGAYLLQLVTKIAGPLDVARLKAAWARVTQRHAVLRSAIHDLDAEQPRQVVHSHADADWSLLDWTDTPEATIDDRLTVWLEQDRSKGFSLARAPLMRFALIALGQDRTAFVWTRHHAIVDGWSSARILQQVFADYDGDATDRDMPAAGFRDYIGWLTGRDAAAADMFWSEYLRGVDGPTPLVDGKTGNALGQGAADNSVFALSPRETEALRLRARQYHVTPATMLRAAWGLVLARNAGAEDAVFGMVVSGRPDALPGVEAIVGPFINTVPARVGVPAPDADIGDWLRALHADQGRIDAHVHVPLTDIQRIARIPGDRAMFETLFIFENYPIDRDAMAASGLASQVTGAQTIDKTSYPLTLLVGVSDTMHARFSYNPSQIAGAQVDALRDAFATAVAMIVTGDAASLAALQMAGGSIAERAATTTQNRATYAVSGTFAPDPLVPFSDHWAQMFDRPLHVTHLGNGQLLQDLLDERSAFGQADFRLVLLRWADLGVSATPDPTALAVEVGAALAVASRHRDVVVILCPSPPHASEDATLVRIADAALRGHLARETGVHLLDAPAAFAEWGVDDPYDEETERIAGMPYTLPGYAALAMAAARVHDALHRAPYKAIIVDADNTLWGGVCGEVGAAGVAVGDGWADFQRFLLGKRAEGFLLCLCSRNTLADVEEVFATRAMPLALDAFTAVRVGWADKAQYVVEIAAELGLGLDSLVFIDDDPANVVAVERDTGVTSVRSPDREDLLGDFAARLWPLDKVRISDADRTRADQHRIEDGRRRAVAGDRRSIVEALGVMIDFAPLEEADLARVADLVQRTNQLNLTLRRRSLVDLRAELASGLEGTVVRVRDRFGDYGVVGAMLYRRGGEDTLCVDTFLLSCRALARGVEEAMARHLAIIGGTRATIVFDAVEGPRNRPALDFFASLPGDGMEKRQVNASTLATVTLRPPDVPTRAVRELRATGRGPAANAAYAELATVIRRADQLLALVSAVDTRMLRRAPYVAPGTEMETVVAGFFGELFAIGDVGRDDSFFGLGGNSLQAVQLAGRIRRTFDAPVQLRVVFENPTVAALAAEIMALTDRDAVGEDDEVMEF